MAGAPGRREYHQRRNQRLASGARLGLGGPPQRAMQGQGDGGGDGQGGGLGFEGQPQPQPQPEGTREWDVWAVLAPFRNHARLGAYASVLVHYIQYHVQVCVSLGQAGAQIPGVTLALEGRDNEKGEQGTELKGLRRVGAWHVATPGRR